MKKQIISCFLLCLMTMFIISPNYGSAKSKSFSNANGEAVYSVGSRKTYGGAGSSASAYSIKHHVCVSVRETVYYYNSKGKLVYHDVDEKYSTQKGTGYVSVGYYIPASAKKVYYTSSHHECDIDSVRIKTHNMSEYY